MSREAQAQILVARALVSGTALPGSGATIPFPDLAAYPDARRIIVSDVGSPAASELPAGLESARVEDLDTLGRGEGPLILLEFLAPEAVPGTLGVRLRLSVASGAARPLPLGEVIQDFTTDGQLAAIGEPRVVAY